MLWAPMGKSASETIRGGEVAGEEIFARPETEPPISTGGNKPR